MSEDQTQTTTTPKIINQPVTPEPKEKVDMSNFVTKEDHNAQLDKIRADERDKQARGLAESKEASEALKAELAALKAQVEGKVDLPKPTGPDLSDQSVLAEMLLEMKAEGVARDAKRAEEALALTELLASYDKRFEEQAEASKKQVSDAHLDVYKTALIESTGLSFPELVTGGTREEIEASVKAVKEREEKISAQAKAKVNGENVQSPLNPGTPSTQKATMKRSMEIASMSPAEYQKWKTEALKEARAQA